MKPIYIKDFISKEDSEKIFLELLNLKWEERTAARKEYFMGSNAESYTYDKRVYTANPLSEPIVLMLHMINRQIDSGTPLNVCFLNRYDNQYNSLGWHFDANIASGAHEKPAGNIGVISFGAEREIWWKEKSYAGKIPKDNRQLLENGSLFIMPKGFQDIYLHKIPKHDRPCGTRISLTFRSFDD